ncbi:MAG: DUF3868 domain-containing protein [Tannerellaceae bacterium]|nr:DUF3868 domain-containing protein [Tannerellaceae bacterium]
MKRYLLIIQIVLMVCTLSIAQDRALPFSSPSGRPGGVSGWASGGGVFPLPEGSLSVTDFSLRQAGDSLMLSMKLYILSQSINSCQSWRILPEVRAGEESVYLPSILINGKKKEQQYMRRSRMKDPKMLTVHYIKEVAGRRKGNHIYYQVKVPYQSWMDQGALHFHQVLTSCRDKE